MKNAKKSNEQSKGKRNEDGLSAAARKQRYPSGRTTSNIMSLGNVSLFLFIYLFFAKNKHLAAPRSAESSWWAEMLRSVTLGSMLTESDGHVLLCLHLCCTMQTVFQLSSSTLFKAS